MRLALLLPLILMSCFPREAPLEPCLHRTPERGEIAHLPSPFSPLTSDERTQEWGVEYGVGVQFARELDLYRAITSFKRALFLFPEQGDPTRQLELHYYIVLSYSLGDRHDDVIRSFEESPLAYVPPNFPAYNDLLLLLHESYHEMGQEAKADAICHAMEENEAHITQLSTSLREADLSYLECEPLFNPLRDQYSSQCKSVSRAQLLSAICPGAGFWYVGQRQSAITSFCLNALFITAAYQFFSRGYYAAGVFTTSLEAGWYFGGIYGAGEAAHDYNVRLYEGLADPALERGNLYPALMLRWGF